jgi:hypothetical protein
LLYSFMLFLNNFTTEFNLQGRTMRSFFSNKLNLGSHGAAY